MDGRLPFGMGAAEVSVSARWGDWRLGDLWAALFRAGLVLGPTARVDRVSVVPPHGSEALPCVQITVADEAAVHRLRANLLDGHHVAHFLSDQSGSGFQVEIEDVLIDVRVAAGEL